MDEFGGNRTALDKTLGQFAGDLAPQLDELRKAVQTKDAQTTGQLTHKLKGAAATMTAQPVADAAERLETAAKSEAWPGSASCLEELEEEVQRLQECFSQTLFR